MLKSMDGKALTPEGKIKSYKIEFDKVKRNPMEGINIYLTINDDSEMKLDTTLEEGTQGKSIKQEQRGLALNQISLYMEKNNNYMYIKMNTADSGLE